MPLTSSDLTRRRKALTNDFDRRNNQWLGANTGPTSTAFEARMVSEATGAKIASARSTEGGAWTSIPLTAFQDLCSSAGQNPTLSDLVKATNVNSVIEQGPTAGINVVQLSGGGIAAYCNGGTFLGAVDAAGNPISLPNPIISNSTWMATINDSLGNSDIMRSFATDGVGGLYILGSYTGPSTVNNAGVAAPTPSALVLGGVPDSAADTGLFIVKYNLSGVAIWATQIHILDVKNSNPVRLVCDGTRVFISSFCKTYANFYNGVTSGTPSASTQLDLSAIVGSPIYNTFIASYACSTGTFNWAAPLTSTATSYFTGGISVRGSALVYTSAYRQTVSVYDATTNGTVGSAIQTYIQGGIEGGIGQNMVMISFNNTTGAIVFSTQIATVNTNAPIFITSLRANVIDSADNIYVCAVIINTNLTIFNANGRGTPSVTTTYNRITTDGGCNLCLIKFNSSGALEWVAPILGSNTQSLTNLLCTSTDDIIIPFNGPGAQVMYSTSRTSTGIATTAGPGQIATHLAKFSNTGVAQWITKLENTVTNGSNIQGLCSLDISDNIYICGGYGPTIIPYSWMGTIGSAGNPVSTGINITGIGQYVMKYTTNGAFISAGKMTSDRFIQVYSILNVANTTYVIGSLVGETIFYGFSSGDPSTLIYSITTSDQAGFLINYL